MALQLPDIAAFKTVPMNQKIALMVLLLGGIGAGFYYLVEDPQQQSIQVLRTAVEKLDKEITVNNEKVKNLEALKKMNAELEVQLVKIQEHLPPESEAATLLKQLTDLGTRIGLSLKSWKPGSRKENPSKLFVELPANVEMTGGYHTLALFFDRISKLPQIINVSKIKMGAGKVEKDRVSVQATFQITAFASPSAQPAPPAAAKPPGKGK